MRRRAVLVFAGNAPIAWHSGARAQKPALPLIGVLSSTSHDALGESELGLRDGLREAGFLEGRNLALEVRFAEGRYELLPTQAAELIALRPSVLVARALPAAAALKAATESIPIVFVVGADPVKQGLVASLARPGRNLTGVTQFYGALGGKRLDLLLELVPGVATVAVLSNPRNPNARNHLDELRAAARALGKHLAIFDAASETDIDAAFDALARRAIGAVLIADDPLFWVWRARIVALAARHTVPAIHFRRDFVAVGGLISYGSSVREDHRLAGGYVGRILNGARPADLPVLQPTTFELVVNLKAARALGLTVPPSILALANEVVE